MQQLAQLVHLLLHRHLPEHVPRQLVQQLVHAKQRCISLRLPPPRQLARAVQSGQSVGAVAEEQVLAVFEGEGDEDFALEDGEVLRRSLELGEGFGEGLADEGVGELEVGEAGLLVHVGPVAEARQDLGIG